MYTSSPFGTDSFPSLFTNLICKLSRLTIISSKIQLTKGTSPVATIPNMTLSGPKKGRVGGNDFVTSPNRTPLGRSNRLEWVQDGIARSSPTYFNTFYVQGQSTEHNSPTDPTQHINDSPSFQKSTSRTIVTHERITGERLSMTIIQQNSPAPESAIAAAYYEDLAPPAVQAISSEQGPQVFCSNGQHSKLAQQEHVGTLIEQPARGIDRSSIFRRQSADSSRLTMHGVKRAFHDGEDRDSKRRDISVRDIDVNQHFFFVLTSSELDDEFKSSRAYQEEICAEY